MNIRPFIFMAVTFLIVVSIYASSTTLPIFVEARKTVTNIECWSQDGGKTRCCGSEVDDTSIYGLGTATYCTTCDDTKPPSNCSPREKIESSRLQDTPANVLNREETKTGSKIPNDFGRLDDSLITKDDSKDSNSGIKVPNDLEGNDIENDSRDSNNDTKVPNDFGRLDDDAIKSDALE